MVCRVIFNQEIRQRFAPFLAAMVLSGSGVLAPQRSASANPPPTYREALKALQQGEAEKAKELFWPLFHESPNHTHLIYNLGLAEFETGGRIMAVALWRRALEIDPWFKSARQALAFAAQEGAPGSPSPARWGTVGSYLGILPLWLMVLINTTLVFLLLSSLLRWLGKKRKQEAETPPDEIVPRPPFPPQIWLYGVLLSGTVALLAFSLFEGQKTWATIVKPEATLKSYPNEQAADLFKLPIGQEVLVKSNSEVKGWIQITYPGGMSGWVPESFAFITSKRRPQ